MNFGNAITSLKNGKRIFRLSWNPNPNVVQPKMVLVLIPGAPPPVFMQEYRAYARYVGSSPGEILPHIAIINTLPDGRKTILPGEYRLSTADILAEDWMEN